MANFLPEDYPDFEEFGITPCSESFPDAFFTEESPESSLLNRGAYRYEREAKTMCAECPYKVRCLEYAMKHSDLQGIWGGTNEHQRKSMRRGLPVRMALPPSRIK
jgi:WhiB family redox-sensing transcriptional regulator